MYRTPEGPSRESLLPTTFPVRPLVIFYIPKTMSGYSGTETKTLCSDLLRKLLWRSRAHLRIITNSLINFVSLLYRCITSCQQRTRPQHRLHLHYYDSEAISLEQRVSWNDTFPSTRDPFAWQFPYRWCTCTKRRRTPPPCHSHSKLPLFDSTSTPRVPSSPSRWDSPTNTELHRLSTTSVSNEASMRRRTKAASRWWRVRRALSIRWRGRCKRLLRFPKNNDRKIAIANWWRCGARKDARRRRRRRCVVDRRRDQRDIAPCRVACRRSDWIRMVSLCRRATAGAQRLRRLRANRVA